MPFASDQAAACASGVGGKSKLKKSSSANMALKEKVVQIYELILAGADPSIENPNVWEELFLLKANIESLEKHIASLSVGSLLKIKDSVNNLFHRCVSMMAGTHAIKIVNAIQTLCGLVRGVFQKSQGASAFNVIDVLVGFHSADKIMQDLIDKIHKIIIASSQPPSLKNLALRFLLTLATATDNMSQNTMLEYLMINNIFDALMQVMSSPDLRLKHGNDAVVLLSLLVQYRKYESTNPYTVNLSILDDEHALNGLSQVITTVLLDLNHRFSKVAKSEETTGLFSTFTNLVGSMLAGDMEAKHKLEVNRPALLALYEAVHLNRNFITVLNTAHTPAISANSAGSFHCEPKEGPAITATGKGGLGELSPGVVRADHATSVFVTFLEFMSVVMQDTKDASNFHDAKLCFLILTCATEDQYANSLMHDMNINYRVPIHRLPMRHRKGKVDVDPPLRPLAGTVIDMMVEFTLSHMMKSFPMELYTLSLGVIHRLLCYQKKYRVRLVYSWKHMWSALINLLKFLLANEFHLLKNHNIIEFCTKIIGMFNMFITFGDTFLPTPSSYDDLYYELIRMHQVFDNLYSMGLRHSTVSDEWRESATKLTSALGNVRAIINHFNPKLEQWATVNHISSLSEQQVLEQVRANYDTLTLKLHEGLDSYDRYSEKPRERAYFTNLVRAVVMDVRSVATVTKMEQITLLQEFAQAE